MEIELKLEQAHFEALNEMRKNWHKMGLPLDYAEVFLNILAQIQSQLSEQQKAQIEEKAEQIVKMSKERKKADKE